MDKYDLKSEPGNNEGMLSVLEYQHGKKVQKRMFNNVYAKGFSQEANFTDDDLVQLFVKYGEILNASVMRDEVGCSKGFGFVCFKDPNAAEACCNALRQQQEDEPQADEKAEVKLFACEAKKKNDRVQQLQINNFKYKKSIMFLSSHCMPSTATQRR